jgi:Tfp pilus assembly protein PilV
MLSKRLQWDQHVAFEGGGDEQSRQQQQQQQQQQQLWAGVHVRSGDKAMEAETFAIRECVARCDIVTTILAHFSHLVA